MMQFPQYESYKDSGVAWLGKVPSHWKLTTGRTCLNEQCNKNIGNKEKTVLSLSYGKIVIKPEEKLHGLVPESFETYQIVTPGNIIIRSTDLQNDKVSLRVGLVKDRGIITSAYLCLNVEHELNPRFTYYLLHSYDVLKVYYGMGSGLRQNLSFVDFKYLPLTFPSQDEQQKIVNFLNQKTAEIDEAIAKKQKLIELLQEQKAILINRAVTKGLNPNVTMRDSGIEWISEIPEHWKVTKLKYLVSRMDYGLSESAKSEGEYRYLNMGHVQDGKVLVEDTGYLDNAPNSLILEHHDILFNRTNSFELVGKSGIYDGTFSDRVTFASYLVRLRTNNKTNSIWLNSILNDDCFLGFIRSLALRSLNQANLNPTRLSQVFVPVPPFKEQSRIADTILKINSSFENQINHAEKSIDLYLELKQILISNAVTGKIKI